MPGPTIRSMTGFGAANAEVDGSRYAVEVRSVNNTFLKTIVRLPDDLVALETDLETAIGRRLRRGSVMVTVRWTPDAGAIAASIDGDAARKAVEELVAMILQYAMKIGEGMGKGQIKVRPTPRTADRDACRPEPTEAAAVPSFPPTRRSIHKFPTFFSPEKSPP